jgi:4-hydroxy-tetrahydrodipicolinate reductase
MGHEIRTLIETSTEFALGAAIERAGHPDLGRSVSGTPVTTDLPDVPLDVLIDFSAPPSVRTSLGLAKRASAALVIGSTGLGLADEAAIEEAATTLPILAAPNLAIGVHVLYRLVAEAARSLPGFDVELVEMHHRTKADAPSGTAKRLVRIVQEASGAGAEVHGRSGHGLRGAGEIGVHALRGGDVAGDHEIVFAGDGEVVRIGHRATGRRAFAVGALQAARFLAGRPPGYYTMDEVVRLAGPR